MESTRKKMNTKEEINSFKRMIESCFTYGGVDPNSYNFERYLLPYRSKLDIQTFNRVYKNHVKKLKSDYVVEKNTYTDCEGLSYNTLKKIN